MGALGRSVVIGSSIVVATVGTVGTPPAAASPPTPGGTLSLRASPHRVQGGRPVTLSGQALGAPAGSMVRLFKSPYPYRAAALVRATVTAADGSFSFVVSPDRDSRYRAVLVGTPEQEQAQVLVTGDTVTKVTALTLGRAEVTILVFHPSDLRWNGAIIKWSFASGSRRRFFATSPTRTRRLSRYVTLVRTVVALPAGRFRFRACFHAPGDQALVNLRGPPGCTGRGYHGGGSLPVGFPGPAAISRAESFLGRRSGVTALAVVDSEGRLSGVHLHRTFITGSVVKAMLLVAYLRRLHALGRHTIDSASNSFLYPMIHVSDNNAATRCWTIVGDSALYALAGAAGMTDFSISGEWGHARLSAADQARFFFEMDSLIPPEFVGYARFLLSTIASYESWGVPAVARPYGYRVFFKGGWRPTGLGQLVHQIARLEGHRRVFSMGVMTDADPSMGYGIDTIQGVTAALLR